MIQSIWKEGPAYNEEDIWKKGIMLRDVLSGKGHTSFSEL